MNLKTNSVMHDLVLKEIHRKVALKALYVRHFIEDMSWWVCRDDGAQCHKITGPWHSAEVAKLSLDLQKGMES